MILTFIHWNVSPDIADLGFFSIRWYSVFFAVGFILSYQILNHYFIKEMVTPGLLDRLTIYMVVATVAGARLGHCLFYDFEYFSDHIVEIFLPFKFEPEFRFIGFQGLASHGGAIAILVVIVFFCHKYKISFLWTLDRLALVIPLAGFMIRMGNLMNSEMIGRPTTVSWAFIFERIDHVPRHPGQLYEAIFYILIFITLNILHRYSHNSEGFIFGLFLVLLFSARFAVEFSKEDQVGFEKNMIFNMGQLLSLPFILTGGVLMLVKRSKKQQRKYVNI